MAVEICIEIHSGSQQWDIVVRDIESSLSELMGYPGHIADSLLTGYQEGIAPNCFLQHWCGSTENIIVQYQLFKDPPDRLICMLVLSMRASPDSRGRMPEYLGDDLDEIKRETQRLVSSVMNGLVSMRPWYRRLTNWRVGVLSIQFVDPFKPTGLTGKWQSPMTVLIRVSNRLAAAIPVLLAMLVVARLNGWGFLEEPTLPLTATVLGYVVFCSIWYVIDLVRLRRRVWYRGI